MCQWSRLEAQLRYQIRERVSVDNFDARILELCRHGLQTILRLHILEHARESLLTLAALESVDIKVGRVRRVVLAVVDHVEGVQASLLRCIIVVQEVPRGAVVSVRALVARRHHELVPQTTESRVILLGRFARLRICRA